MTLKINYQDAKETWGIGLEDGALAALMTFPALKERVENKSRLQHGTRIITSQAIERWDERTLNLPFHLCAKTEAEYIANLNSFMTELRKGKLILEVTHSSFNKTYTVYYQSCTSYSHYYGGMAKFILKVKEPIPAND